MKLWHSIFIVTFVFLYGTLSLVLLGSWILDTARVLRDTSQKSSQRLARARAVIGATVLATAAVGILITHGSLIFYP